MYIHSNDGEILPKMLTVKKYTSSTKISISTIVQFDRICFMRDDESSYVQIKLKSVSYATWEGKKENKCVNAVVEYIIYFKKE